MLGRFALLVILVCSFLSIQIHGYHRGALHLYGLARWQGRMRTKGGDEQLVSSSSSGSWWELQMGKPPPNPPHSKGVIPADKKLPKTAPLVPEFSRLINADQVPSR